VYSSFGRERKHTGAVSERYGYTSREIDAESAFLYYRARYYNPGQGRFLAEDPVKGIGDNQYPYCYNTPNNLVDSFGMHGMTKEDYEKIGELYAQFQDVGRRLQEMWSHWKPGQTFTDYGVTTLANAAGYRSPEFSSYPAAFREAVEEIEGNVAVNVTQLVQLVVIGAAGYWNPINRIFRSSGYAASQFWLTRVAIERWRNKWLLAKLDRLMHEYTSQQAKCRK
jgi:RHS repeat-associated protein